MKKQFLWMLAAILMLSGTAMLLTACVDKHDNPAGDPDTIENYVLPEPEQTDDDLKVTIKEKTYVFDGNYTAEGKALVARAADCTTALTVGEQKLPNEEIENIIVHNDRIENLSNKELAVMVIVLSKGGSIAIADPTIDGVKLLASHLRSAIIDYLETNSDPTARYVMKLLNTKALQRIIMWTNNFDFSVYLNGEGKGDYMSLLILREDDSYMAFDEKGTLSAYQYGRKANRAAGWMNERESEAQKAARRLAAARMMASRAGDDAEAYVDKIADAKTQTFDTGITVDGPSGYSKHHDCTVTYTIYTAYSKEKNCDVYCVTQTVNAYNQILECGPKDEQTWYNGQNWQPWEDLSKKQSGLRKDVFGPYMKQIYAKCELQDGDNKMEIENYAPQNSTSGGETDTDGFTFSLGANASVSASGPQVGVNSNMAWSHTVSKVDPDLSMKASPSEDGVTEWTYTGPDVHSHFSLAPWKSHTHEFPRSIQVSMCTVEQAWVWTVAGSTSNTVTIKPTFKLQDDWLTYDRAFDHIGQAYSHYLSVGDMQELTPIVVNCPPRFCQTWSMSVKTDAKGADVTKIINYLTDQLKQYVLASCVFYTQKADHKQAYNKNKSAAEYDEIGQFVQTAKDAFTNNQSVIEILREAGKVGGLTDNDSYTIVWRQTDAGVNSDQEEFTFKMKK